MLLICAYCSTYLHKMRYYLIAGEPSGDMHGANLMRSLKAYDQQAQFRYYGGDKMEAEGGTLVCHYRDTAVMGFVRVITHLPTILRNIKHCRADIAAYKPDVVILIDYPGFNLKIAKYVKKVLHLPVYYYIPPKIWAWKEGRIKQIKKYIDRVYAIFPFEVDFYAKHGVEAVYVGNPSVQTVQKGQKGLPTREVFLQQNNLPEKPLIALLPGSRKQEVVDSIWVFSQLKQSDFEGYQLVMAATSAVSPALYAHVPHHIRIVYDQTYSLLAHAVVGAINSGTATLETALFKLPQVVCYGVKFSRIALLLKPLLIKIPYVSLVNIIAQKEVVKELLGHHFKATALTQELQRLLHDKAYRNRILAHYDAVAQSLGTAVASDTAAKDMVQSQCEV